MYSIWTLCPKDTIRYYRVFACVHIPRRSIILPSRPLTLDLIETLLDHVSKELAIIQMRPMEK